MYVLLAIGYDSRMKVHAVFQHPWLNPSVLQLTCFLQALLHKGLWLPILLLVFLLPAEAAEVDGLYRAHVEVSSRENEQERQRAFSTAMRRVLVKISGRNQVLDNAAIRRAVIDPQSYVASWAYRSVRRSQVDEEGGQGRDREAVELEVVFYEPALRELLTANSIPVWPSNRPVTLVWLAVQDELGERQVLGSANNHEVVTQLRAEAEARGLPLLFPLLDLQDMRALNMGQLWNLDQEAVRRASARYQVESILVIRIFRALSGENLGSTAYLFRDRALGQDIYEDTLESFLEIPVDMAARELSDYYGVLLSGTSNRVKVKMTVDGVDSVRDYGGLMKYLGGLTDVNSFNLIRVEQDTVELELSTGGQIRQLAEFISLDQQLVPQAELTRDGEAVYMHYRWSD